YPRRRDPCGNPNGLVQVPCLDQIEPGQLLLRFRKGTVDGGELTIAHAHGGRRVRRLKGFRDNGMATLAQFLVDGDVLLRETLEIAFGHGFQCLLLTADQAEIFHFSLRALQTALVPDWSSGEARIRRRRSLQALEHPFFPDPKLFFLSDVDPRPARSTMGRGKDARLVLLSYDQTGGEHDETP